MNEFGKAHPKYTFAPMSACVSAMSQGYIGYDLQNAIRTELLSRGIYKPVATVLTQVVIDPYDDAFAEPEKIIGRVLTAEEAEAEEEKGNYVTEISEGQFRRILASPKPQRIVEIETIRALASAGQIVIAAGGGGIPVLEQGIELHGASAIVEKDLASGLLAEELNADTLLTLTSVEKVNLNMGTENEELLGSISAEDAHKYVEADQFTKGSMLPKIEAGLSFIEKKRADVLLSQILLMQKLDIRKRQERSLNKISCCRHSMQQQNGVTKWIEKQNIIKFCGTRPYR